MPLKARVIDSTRHGDGTVESLVRASAFNEGAAARRAKNAALLDVGYPSAFTGDPGEGIGVEVQSIEQLTNRPLRNTYDVEVEITGVGAFFEG